MISLLLLEIQGCKCLDMRVCLNIYNSVEIMLNFLFQVTNFSQDGTTN